MSIKKLYNKSFITNSVAICVTLTGYFIPVYGNLIFMMGAFALSGSITNWLAIYMLFNKIPYLYGSGIITNRFEDFKDSIKKLIMNEFFTKKNIDKFSTNIRSHCVDQINWDYVFNSFIDIVKESKISTLLSIMGGHNILLTLKQPILDKLKHLIAEEKLDQNVKLIILTVEKIIDKRLKELTPQQIKNIIQSIIKEHLGWLVVWGGIFGGLIGLIVTLLDKM